MKIASRSSTLYSGLGSLIKRNPTLPYLQTRRTYSTPAPPARRNVDLFINDMNVSVPEGTTIIQACDSVGIFIPRFCYHESLSIAGNCRMCLVEVAKSMKPIASCAMPVSPGMSSLLLTTQYWAKLTINQNLHKHSTCQIFLPPSPDPLRDTWPNPHSDNNLHSFTRPVKYIQSITTLLNCTPVNYIQPIAQLITHHHLL